MSIKLSRKNKMNAKAPEKYQRRSLVNREERRTLHHANSRARSLKGATIRQFQAALKWHAKEFLSNFSPLLARQEKGGEISPITITGIHSCAGFSESLR
ncbi:hypothetical protein CEXT_221261 [Caerostris extrusa]|uniref:Uncharacterized protein n=1 Tax=Caerostris extrusa TaxID=172846 RepID=A0AAV4W0H5_CAEEX|nr:hypothetical protein CEXT_221261 [Caerostris extrusa]